MKSGVSTKSLSFNRKMIIASATVSNKKNAFHSYTELDVSEARQIIKTHFEKTGEKLSFTGYIVKCLAQTIKQYPQFNSFIKGRKLIILDDVVISVMIEREFEGEKIPESLGIHQTDVKTYRQINDEIRAAQNHTEKKLGSLANMTWIRFIPVFLMKKFVCLADTNIRMAKRYGKIAVTSVGMFTNEPVWFIPHGTATVMLTIGSIAKKMVYDGTNHKEREFLCLTASFDHNIIDGAPAARFMNQLIETIRCGDLLHRISTDEN